MHLIPPLPPPHTLTTTTPHFLPLLAHSHTPTMHHHLTLSLLPSHTPTTTFPHHPHYHHLIPSPPPPRTLAATSSLPSPHTLTTTSSHSHCHLLYLLVPSSHSYYHLAYPHCYTSFTPSLLHLHLHSLHWCMLEHRRTLAVQE